MRYYVIAGEASGDLHAAGLLKELKRVDSEAEFRCWGGDLMKAEGAVLVKHYRDLAFMGFAEVVAHLPVILKNFRLCESDLLDWKPDVLILVDYPGFNLRMARFASEKGIPVFYYISPQLWAWHASRVKKIKRYVDRMFVILPFEKKFYQGFDYPVDYVGHPLLDVIPPDEKVIGRSEFLQMNHLEDKPIVALLPGSRKMEVTTILKAMLSVVSEFPGYQFVVAGAPSLPASFYRGLLEGSGATLVSGQTYALLSNAEAALVTSGTATLETALFNVPQVVCYRGNPISYLLARNLVKVKYISLVNLIADRSLVPELIQGALTTGNLSGHLNKLLNDPFVRGEMKSQYRLLREELGGTGAASRTANLMVQYLLENRV